MNELVKGAIITLYENDKDRYIIFGITEKDGEKYAVLHPFLQEVTENATLNVSMENMLIIKVKQGNDFEYVTDENLIKSIIEKIEKEEQV